MKTEESIAYHEAGHAAVAVHLRVGLQGTVSIVPEDGSDGRVRTRESRWLWMLESDDSDFASKASEKRMMVSLAGMEAQRINAPTSVRRHHGDSDRRNVFTVASKLCGDLEETEALIRLLQIRTRKLLKQPNVWRGVKALARELLAHEEVTARKAKEIVEKASVGRRKPPVLVEYTLETAPADLLALMKQSQSNQE